MKLDVKTIRLQNALHAVREWQDPDHLVVRSEQSLILVNWLSFQHRPETEQVVLGPKGEGRLIANEVAIDNAFAIDSKSQHILLARQGEISVIDPANPAQVQKVNVTGLPRGTFGAALASDSQRILFATVHVVTPDFATYALALVDLTNGTLSIEKTISSTADLELLWDNATNTWAIGDTGNGTLWRCDGSRPAVKLAGPPEHADFATFTASGEGVIVSAVATKPTGETVLLTGRAEHERIEWTAPVVLPGSGVLMARRHSVEPFWACLTQQGSVQHIKIVGSEGQVLADEMVRPGSHLIGLQWSAFSPARLWSVGIHTLMAVSLAF